MRKNIWLLVSILFITGVLSSFASSSPDGLERVAKDVGFAELENPHSIPTVMSDYSLAWIPSNFLATSTAGLIGAGLTWLFITIICQYLKKTKRRKENEV